MITSQFYIAFIPLSVSLGTILVTPFSMVWDWRVSRAGPMPFYRPSCSLPFCLQLFFLCLLSFYWLVRWGWGLRTDRVLIDLPAFHCKPFLIIILYHNFLPPTRRGSHFKSDNTHTMVQHNTFNPYT